MIYVSPRVSMCLHVSPREIERDRSNMEDRTWKIERIDVEHWYSTRHRTQIWNQLDDYISPNKPMSQRVIVLCRIFILFFFFSPLSYVASYITLALLVQFLPTFHMLRQYSFTIFTSLSTCGGVLDYIFLYIVYRIITSFPTRNMTVLSVPNNRFTNNN